MTGRVNSRRFLRTPARLKESIASSWADDISESRDFPDADYPNGPSSRRPPRMSAVGLPQCAHHRQRAHDRGLDKGIALLATAERVMS
jgi:hypothetical protein